MTENTFKTINRRALLKGVGGLGAAAVLSGVLPASARAGLHGPKVHVFSKHLQWLDYDAMAETAAAIGFNGVDLTVRPKGHVLPENVERDLPRAVAAIRGAGLTADRITTSITDPDDPLTLRILAAASEQGIGIYRMGWLKYDRDRAIPPQLDALRSRFGKLEAINRRFAIHGAYQNHSGVGVGSPVWDAWLLTRDLDPQWLGIRYDVRHAMAEGARSWELGLQLLAPQVRSLDVKDFYWTEQDGEWGIENVPLGQGAVDFPRYFDLLQKWDVNADMTLHLEYPLGGADKGKSELTIPAEQVTAAMKQDLEFLRSVTNQ